MLYATDLSDQEMVVTGTGHGWLSPENVKWEQIHSSRNQGCVWLSVFMLNSWLFFHPDLQDLMLRHGWRTGAIVPELETEIRIINTEQYMHSLTWQQALTGLLERMQVNSSWLSRTGYMLPSEFEFWVYHGD